MARVLTDWLSAYLRFTEDSEPPQSYHIWTGMSILAGALQRRAYMTWGRQTIYPNLYIILVGPSGFARKGTALAFAYPLFDAAKIKTIQGAIIREKLIRRMADAISSFTDQSTGDIKFQCSLTVISDELAVFLGQQNLKFLADLCNWYDCPATWKYDTKHEGTDKLDGVCFNLIGATAPDWIHTMLPNEAIGGGFTSRIVWIVEEMPEKDVVHPTIDEELEKALIADLEQILLISGEYKFSDGADQWYSDWYIAQNKSIREGKPPIPDPRFAGYCSRRATLLKKISIIVSASRRSIRIIDIDDIKRAYLFIKTAEKKMARAFAGLGQGRYAYATELILGFVLKHRVVTRSQVLKFFFKDIDDYTFDVAVKCLEKMHVLKVTYQPKENEVILEAKTEIGKLPWEVGN